MTESPSKGHAGRFADDSVGPPSHSIRLETRDLSSAQETETLDSHGGSAF